MPKLSLIIPVYNEELQLQKKIESLRAWKRFFQGDLEILIIDSNSTDRSDIYFSILQNEKIAQIFYLSSVAPAERSIGRALAEACSKVSAASILILPVDIDIQERQISEVIKLMSSAVAWGAFIKKYDSNNPLMNFYGHLQNQILTRWLKQVVWTNVFFFKRDLAIHLPAGGFLEDIIFSDRLNKIAAGCILPHAVVVNIRKYKKDGLSRRIFFNGLILLLFRLGYHDLVQLKEFYLGKLSLFQLLNKLLKAAQSQIQKKK